MPTLHVSCSIKVGDNETRMKWSKILVSNIMTLSKRLKSDQVWLSWAEWWTSSKCTQIKQKWFTQSQKKKDLNRVSNTILGAFCWNWANHSGKLCNANGIKATNHILILSRSEEGTLKSRPRNTIQGDLCWRWANTIITESKPEV